MSLTGTSTFDYYLLNDAVKLRVRVDWIEDEATVPEVLMVYPDGAECDVTEDICSFGLFDKLIEYAEDNLDSAFTSFEEDQGERQWRSARDY